jgi:tetratricopeptide (TPR) repeat protein
VARAEKTKADNERIAAGRKYFDAAGRAERSFLTNESSIQARQIQWGEKLEEQQQRYLATAIENYRESLKYIPDASVAEEIRELEATLEGRKKYLAGVRQTGQVQAEAAKKATADRLWQEGTALYHQGRPADALAKFKESWAPGPMPRARSTWRTWSQGARRPCPSETRGGPPEAEPDPGGRRQIQGSLGYWSDAALADHIRKLEANSQPPRRKDVGADNTDRLQGLLATG